MRVNKKTYVLADLNTAGLCNLLLVWSKAFVFAYVNGLPLYVHGWGNIRIGPWIRREKSKRFYGRYFHRNTCHIKHAIICKFNQSALEYEPMLEMMRSSRRKAYIFNTVPNKGDYFLGLREHRERIVSGFLKMLKSQYINNSYARHKKHIGLHVRRGDFKIVESSVTPLSYFINVVNEIRSIYQSNIPVTIFSDGDESELTDLLDLTNVELYQSGVDITDLITLSKLSIIVPSPGSTFSLWAGFISSADIIVHDGYNNGAIRSTDVSEKNGLFEGTISDYYKYCNAREDSMNINIKYND